MLEGLNLVEVRAFTFGEAVLTIELKFGCNNRVFAPTVHIKSGFGENECACIRYIGAESSAVVRVGTVAERLI